MLFFVNWASFHKSAHLFAVFITLELMAPYWELLFFRTVLSLDEFLVFEIFRNKTIPFFVFPRLLEIHPFSKVSLVFWIG